MGKESIVFGVHKRDGVICRIGRSSMLLPPVKFRGDRIKWYEDKIKQ